MSERTWYPMFDPMSRGPWYRGFKFIWLQRPEWPEPQKAPSDGLDPQMNAMGLYWTPVLDGDEAAPRLQDELVAEPARRVTFNAMPVRWDEALLGFRLV